MVYNNVVLTESVSTHVCTDPLQFCIEAAESDHKLFEALITVDMTEAAQKHGLVQLTESDMSYMIEAAEKGVKERLLDLIAKFKNAMNTLFDRFFTFVQNLIANDKKLYEKYGKILTVDAVKNCPITGKVSIDHTKLDEAVGYYKEINNEIIGSMNVAYKDKSTVFENIKTKYEAAQAIKFIDDSDKKLVEKCDVDTVIDTVKKGYKVKVESAKTTKTNVMTVVNKAEKKAKEEQNNAVKDAVDKKDDNAVKTANETYEYVSKIVSTCSKAMSAYVRTVQKSIAIDRGNFIVLGNWVAKGSKTEAPAEGEKTEAPAEGEKTEKVGESYNAIDEAYDMLLEMTSDSYCESIWEATAV